MLALLAPLFAAAPFVPTGGSTAALAPAAVDVRVSRGDDREPVRSMDRQVSSARTEAADTTLVLRWSESIGLPGGRLVLLFEDVVEDSRCPRGVQCVWEGNARVVLRMSDGTDELALLELNTHPQFGGTALVPGFELRLVELGPLPRFGRVTEKDEYSLRLLVVPHLAKPDAEPPAP